MANPASVKGVRRILDGLVDQSMEAAKKARKVGEDVELEVTAHYEVDGLAAFDREGDLGFSGRIEADLPSDVPADAEMSVTTSRGWQSAGAGNHRLVFDLVLRMRPRDEPQ